MITINMSDAAMDWDKAEYFEVQAWCSDCIGEITHGWDTDVIPDLHGGVNVTFMFEHDAAATMFMLRWSNEIC